MRIAFFLPPIHIERLTEVAFAVKQAHGDKWDAKVAGAFQVIAGQNSQAA